MPFWNWCNFAPSRPWFYGAMGLGLLLSLCAPLATRLQARIHYKSISSAEQEIVGQVGVQGVETAMEGVESRVGWAAIKRVIATDSHLLLVISKREAIVLPRRAFANDQAFGAATAWARSKVPAVAAK